MQTFVRRNFKTLLEDKTLCDISIEVGRANEEKKTFACVGALIAVHTKKLRDKIFCTSNHHHKTNINSNNITTARPTNHHKSSKIELIESKEEEIIIFPLDDDEYDDEYDDNNKHNRTIKVTNISTTTFEYLRLLFYGLNPSICITNVIGIYDSSLKYSLTPLRLACLSYIDSITLTIDEYPLQFLSLILDCQRYDLYSMIDSLILKLPTHISHSFFSAMINNNYFHQLNNAVIQMLLFQNNCFADMPQEYVWIAVLKWAKNKLKDICIESSETYSDIDHESEEKEIIRLSSDDEESTSIINTTWNDEILNKLRHFVQYFEFKKMKHLFFRQYVQNIPGLLSESEVICVLQMHCDDMISAMKAMENVIELQRYDSNYDNNNNLNTKRYKMQMYKTKEISFHSQDLNLDLFYNTDSFCKNKILSSDNNTGHGAVSILSYNYPQLKLFIHENIKALFKPENALLCDVLFEIGVEAADKKCYVHGIRALFAIHSPVFKSMLYGNMLESQSINNVNVILHDMTLDIFYCLTSYFYGFSPRITYKNVIGLFYHCDKYLIAPLKQLCMQYVNDIDISLEIEAFLYILQELQTYNLCSIWKSIICDMIKSIDINNEHHITHFLQILNKLYGCGLHDTYQLTIENINIKQSITCQQILFDKQFLKLPKKIIHEIIKTFRYKYQSLINQENLWTATVSWAKAQTNHKNKQSTSTKEVMHEFLKYFDFKCFDAEFMRDFVECVGVLNEKEMNEIYRRHSQQLTDLQKRINKLQLENKQQQQQNLHYQNRLKLSEKNIRNLKKFHKTEMTQIRSQYNLNINSMNTLYTHNKEHKEYKEKDKDKEENNIRFEWYSREYLSLSKNGKQITTIRDDCSWLLSYLNIKCMSGVHIFSIKAHECEHGYDAIGVISVRDQTFLCGKHFPDNKLGYQYYYHPAQHSWSKGETITVLIDCISSRIVFKKNGIIVQKNEIEKNKIYYPVLQTCGCAGHRYEILEYKNISSSL